MISIKNLTELFDKLSQQNFLVDAKRCISIRNRNVICNKCAHACASGCISINENKLKLDTTQCIQCGTCANACPTGAIQITQPPNKSILENISRTIEYNNGTLPIVCTPQFSCAQDFIDPETMVSVACLGRIDESYILAGAALGASRIYLITKNCEDCSYCNAYNMIKEVYKSAEALLSAWNIPCTLKLTQKFPKLCAKQKATEYDYARRDFFKSVKNNAKKSGQQTTLFMAQKVLNEAKPQEILHEHVNEKGMLPASVPQKRVVLINALDEFGKPCDIHISGRLFRRVCIDAKLCNGCQMCAVFCPSAALTKKPNAQKSSMQKSEKKPLKLYRAPGNPHLKQEIAQKRSGETPTSSQEKNYQNALNSEAFISLINKPKLCLNCETCVQVCPQQAISLKEDISASELFGDFSHSISLKNTFFGKGGPHAIRNSMSKLIDSPYIWG